MTDPVGSIQFHMERDYGFYAAKPMTGFLRRRSRRVPATTLPYVKRASKNSPPPLAGSVDGRSQAHERRFDSLSPSFISSESHSVSHACISMPGMRSCGFALGAVDSSFESGDRIRVSSELLTLVFSSSLLCREMCMKGAAMIRRRRETWTE